MKIFKKLMTLVALAGVSFVQASGLDTDFEQIAADTNVIVETSEKATRGIDWNFELTNQDAENDEIYIVLKNNDIEILPASAQGEFETQGYYTLEKGKTVRVAGLDLGSPLELLVLTPSDMWGMKEQGPFAKGKDSILKQAKNEGRLRKGMIGKDKTIFMVFENGLLKPLVKGLFKRTTASGLPLDKNIKE